MSAVTAAGPEEDLRWMEAALNLGSRSLVLTAPNPSVGAILVSGSGRSAGRRRPGEGRMPSVVAITDAGEAARAARRST